MREKLFSTRELYDAAENTLIVRSDLAGAQSWIGLYTRAGEVFGELSFIIYSLETRASITRFRTTRGRQAGTAHAGQILRDWLDWGPPSFRLNTPIVVNAVQDIAVHSTRHIILLTAAISHVAHLDVEPKTNKSIVKEVIVRRLVRLIEAQLEIQKTSMRQMAGL